MSLRFDSSSNFIAAGYSTGRIAMFNLKDNKISSSILTNFPITSVRWKPASKAIILIVSSDGLIAQIHSFSCKTLYQMKEKDNQIMCADYSSDGNSFATCGDDKIVRLYDDNTKMLCTDFFTISNKLPDITNRIYSVKFSPTDSNLLVSGGWDSTIHFFDIRLKNRVGYLYGPHICGDGIDIKDNLMLTTSCSSKEQVTLWDLRMRKAYLTLNVCTDNGKETNLYAGRFNKSMNTFAVVGANIDMLRVYNYNNDFSRSDAECICDQLEHPCYSVDFSSDGNKIIYSGFDSMIRIITIK